MTANKMPPESALLPSVIPVSEQKNYPSIPIGYTCDVDGSWVVGSAYDEADYDE